MKISIISILKEKEYLSLDKLIEYMILQKYFTNKKEATIYLNTLQGWDKLKFLMPDFYFYIEEVMPREKLKQILLNKFLSENDNDAKFIIVLEKIYEDKRAVVIYKRELVSLLLNELKESIPNYFFTRESVEELLRYFRYLVCADYRSGKNQYFYEALWFIIEPNRFSKEDEDKITDLHNRVTNIIKNNKII